MSDPVTEVIRAAQIWDRARHETRKDQIEAERKLHNAVLKLREGAHAVRETEVR